MIMKSKVLYIGSFLLAAATMSACVKERPSTTSPDNTPKVVGLSVDGALTKGEVTTDKDDILSLGIFGYSTGTENFDHTNPLHTPNLFANREAARANAISPWVYNPVAVWPSDMTEKSTFFAYSPYEPVFPDDSDGEFEVPTVNSGYPKIHYRVPSKVSEQIDLLYSEYNADVTNINYGTNTANPGHVKYNMKHAMLWLRFLIATVQETDGTNPNPESYTITEFYMSGGNIMAAGEFNMGTASWSPIDGIGPNQDGYESATYEFDYLWDDPLVVPANATQPLGGTTRCLMMIPHNFVTSVNLTSVAISYTHDDGSTNPSDTEYYVTLPFPDVQLGRPGYVMTYVVKVSTSGAWITFQEENTIEKWLEDTTDRPIEVF